MHPDPDKILVQPVAQERFSLQLTAMKLVAMLMVVAMVYSLFHLGSQPVAVGLIPSPWDKVVHAATFGVFAFLWGYSASLFRLRQRWLLVLAFMAALFVGMLDEFHQLSLPGRHASWDDLASDAFGALAGVLALARSGMLRRG